MAPPIFSIEPKRVSLVFYQVVRCVREHHRIHDFLSFCKNKILILQEVHWLALRVHLLLASFGR